eukprot:1142435-Pelagomonas_calceolata.AAC.6
MVACVCMCVRVRSGNVIQTGCMRGARDGKQKDDFVKIVHGITLQLRYALEHRDCVLALVLIMAPSFLWPRSLSLQHLLRQDSQLGCSFIETRLRASSYSCSSPSFAYALCATSTLGTHSCLHSAADLPTCSFLHTHAHSSFICCTWCDDALTAAAQLPNLTKSLQCSEQTPTANELFYSPIPAMAKLTCSSAHMLHN